MPNARIVLAQGLIDGVNTVFATGVPYVPGSTAYILNGRIHSQALARGPDNDFGYIELDADAGTIQVDLPPELDDVVQIFFWDRLVTPQPPVTVLVGTIPTGSGGTGGGAAGQPLQGVIRTPEVTRLSGVMSSRKLTGVIKTPEPDKLTGTVRSPRIVGTIKERC